MLTENVKDENGATPGGSDGATELLHSAITHSHSVSNAAAPMRHSFTAAAETAAATQHRIRGTSDAGMNAARGVVDEIVNGSLRQMVAQLCRPSSLLLSWQYVDKMTGDPAARRAQDDMEAFLLGYPSVVSAAAVLRQLYENYSLNSDETIGGSAARVVQISKQLRVLQLLHAWLDPVKGFPEDLLSDGTRCTAEVAAATEELERMITAVESATDDTALLIQQDGGLSIPGVPVEPNGGPFAAEALQTAIENAMAGGGLPKTLRARMLAIPRIFGDKGKQLSGGGRQNIAPPPAVKSSWSAEQWDKCQLWCVQCSENTYQAHLFICDVIRCIKC